MNNEVTMHTNYALMRKNIARAVTTERQQGRFLTAIRDSLPELHHNILLPQQDGPSYLTCFVIRYIEVVPAWLQQLEDLCDSGGVDFSPVREIIAGSFAESGAAYAERAGLLALLSDAYLAHRVLEEVNDYLQPACGMPLLPMDTMVANLVVREILGEQFACELDALCARMGQHYGDQHLSTESLVALILCKQRINETPGNWPDFANELNVHLKTPVLEPEVENIH